MRIEFTVQGASMRRDVAVTATATTVLGDVLPELARLVGASGSGSARLGARNVSDQDTVRSSELRNGSVLVFGDTAEPPERGGLLVAHVVGGATVRDPVVVPRGGLSLGRDPTCGLVLDDDRASRRHARLRVEPRGVVLHDLDSTNGTRLDGVRVPAGGRLVEHDAVIEIGDSLLRVERTRALPAIALTPHDDGTVQVRRGPRPPSPPPVHLVRTTAPSDGAPPGRVQWLAAVLPALAGGVLAWALASPLFLLFALVSPAMVLSGALGDRLSWRRLRRRHARERRLRAASFDEQVGVALRAETAALRAAAPDPATVLQIAQRPGRRLWERQRGDGDALVVRLGSLDAPARTTIGDADGRGSESAGSLPMVPYLVDLRDGPLGVVGPDADVAAVVRWLIGQLAVLHSPADLEIVVLTDSSERCARWGWCRWLPHVRSPQMPMAALGALLDQPRPSRAAARTGPWTLVLVDHLRAADAAGLAAVLAEGSDLGVTAIWTARTPTELPRVCRTVARVDGHSSCRLSVTGETSADLVADRVPRSWAERVARSLAPLRDAYAAPAMPRDCTLGDQIPELDRRRDDRVGAVRRRWSTSDGGAAAPIGVGRDGPLTLDLATDGPHALIAGTTGSGKSELLRSLVVGLAATHPPDELSFLLVDYKGGAAFAELARLPHTTGLVTDLDARLTSRALRSLHAELRRREALLGTVGADDLVGYRRIQAQRTCPPLARLVIVVDEFAELAAELPAFVTGLVGVARRGRSLGVHLVLATQRPGSAVSPEIRANTGLRIALRVTDPAESRDVIDAADAALLDPARPGLACLRAAGRLTMFQVARVAAAAQAAVRVETLDPEPDPPQTRDEPVDDELSAVVDLLRAAAGDGGTTTATRTSPWLPPLPAAVPLGSLIADDRAAIGRLDLPDEQSQPALLLDPAGGSLLVVGRGGSGRSTALLSAALARAELAGPHTTHFYLVESGDALATTLGDLPHVAASIGRDDLDLVPRLLDRLAADRPARTSPRSVLLVDDWDLLCAGVGDAVAAEWTDALAALARRATPGTLVAVSGGRSLLTPRFAANFTTRLLLALSDPADYGLAGIPAQGIGAVPEPGGGYRAPEGTVFRIAHPGHEPTPVAARHHARQIAERWRERECEPAPTLLRPLPGRVELADLRVSAEARDAVKHGIVLGLAGEAAAPCVLDVVTLGVRMLVAGPSRSGRSSTLMTAALGAAGLGQDVAVLAPPRSPLRDLAHRSGLRLLTGSEPAPVRATLLLVDDVETCHAATIDVLVSWLGAASAPLGVMVAGRTEDLVTSYNPLVAAVRRERCGILLHPTRLDGDLLGVRVPPVVLPRPPGRGLIVGDAAWGRPFDEAEAVPVQIAAPPGR